MIPLRNIISLSETEGSASASASEVESADEDRPMTGSSSGLSRRKSLDPANHLSRSGSRSFWSSSPSTATSMSASNHSTSSSHLNPTSSTSISRDTSPIGRALSRTFSTSKSLSRSSKSRSSSNKPPKIPKPSREQMNYVKKIMKEIPASGGIPLSAQLRWSLPDKSGASSGSSSHSHGGEKMVGSGGGREEQAGTDLYDCLVSVSFLTFLSSLFLYFLESPNESFTFSVHLRRSFRRQQQVCLSQLLEIVKSRIGPQEKGRETIKEE